MRITLLTCLRIKWLPRVKTVFGNELGKFLLLQLSGRTRVLSSPQSTTSGMMTQHKHDVELDADDHKVFFCPNMWHCVMHVLKMFTGRPSQKLEWEKASQQCLLWSTVPRWARWNMMEAVLNDIFNTSKVDLDDKHCRTQFYLFNFSTQTDFTAAEGFKSMLKDFSLRSQVDSEVLFSKFGIRYNN